MHSHIGFDSILIDYLHPRKFALLGPLAKWVLRAVTGLAVWGCYEFNTNDIGEFGPLPPNVRGDSRAELTRRRIDRAGRASVEGLEGLSAGRIECMYFYSCNKKMTCWELRRAVGHY